MMKPNHYEITVVRNGQHYFATAERSLTTEREATACFNHLCQLFPASEGYSLSLTRWEGGGHCVAQRNAAVADAVAR